MKKTNLSLLFLGALFSLPACITSFPFPDNANAALSEGASPFRLSNHTYTTLVPDEAPSNKTPSFIPDYISAPAGNPFLPGILETPDIVVYDGVYWVFTSQPSDECGKSAILAFSSPDLVTWMSHEKVLDATAFHAGLGSHPWPCEVSSPSSAYRDGKYYLYIILNPTSNMDDIEFSLLLSKIGGIAVGVADHPAGPYTDGRLMAQDSFPGPLLMRHGFGGTNMQLIDPSVFVDDDGEVYLYWGNCRTSEKGRCSYFNAEGDPSLRILKLNENMVQLGGDALSWGGLVTPEFFSDSASVFKRGGTYYMAYGSTRFRRLSEDKQGAYSIRYATSPHPRGPWEYRAILLSKLDESSDLPSHPSVVNVPGTDVFYMVYNRVDLAEYEFWLETLPGMTWVNKLNGNRPVSFDRRVAYERLEFDDKGLIKRARMRTQDNFDDGIMDDWGVYTNGDFRVRNEKLVGRNGLATIMSTNWFDTVVAEADIQLSSTTAAYGSAGVVVRARPYPGNQEHPYDRPFDYTGTYAGISMEGGGRVMLEAAGEDYMYSLPRERRYQMYSVPMPIERGKTYHVRLTAVDDVLKVFVDDMMKPRIVSTCQDEGNFNFRSDGRAFRPWCWVLDFPSPPKTSRWLPPPRIEKHPQLEGEVPFGNVGVRAYEATAEFDNFSASGLVPRSGSSGRPIIGNIGSGSLEDVRGGGCHDGARSRVSDRKAMVCKP
ncbi:glycosyl hydrolase [Coniochaeta sp. 2T2.1]|nr:glycosyl hydrolase [Coniochaeta sp. 2T2.1]